jgi:hypothetical protein
VFWVGTEVGEIKTVTDLDGALVPYAVIQPVMVCRLDHDRLASGEPTLLQQEMRQLFSDGNNT